MTIDMITGKTKIYGIIGFPVHHSLSPIMQNMALHVAGIDGVYVPFAVAPDQLAEAVAGLRALQICGFNVTIPHKVAVMPLLDELAPTAVLAGAVNTVVNQSGRLIGHNTDGDGLIASIVNDLGCQVTGTRVVLIGAGGAARGALAALCRAEASSVVVVNRTLSSVETLLSSFASGFPKTKLRFSAFGEQLSEILPSTDLVINATSLGMAGEKIEGLALALLPDHAKVYDMVYNPAVTPLLRDACAYGLKAVNGFGMLVAQGERAFALWHTKPADSGVMRGALDAFLSSSAKA